MDHEIMFRYITKKATAEEISSFEAWLNESGPNRKIFNDWKEFWETTGKSYSDFNPDTHKRWKELEAIIEKKPDFIRTFSRKWQRIAAGIVLFILLAAGFAILSDTVIHTEKYVSAGDTLGIRLKDGSKICLNANSALKIRSNLYRHERSVELTGEAYFDIKKDPERPFKVFTQQTVTEVLGTSFNIRSREPVVYVTLVTGSVSLYREKNAEKRLILKPGEHGVFDIATDKFLKDTLSNFNNIAWKTGKLQFSESSMSELSATLSGYYKTQIIFPGSDEFNGSFSGIIDGISLDETISIIELTLDLEATRTNDSIIFSTHDEKQNHQ